MFKSAKRVLSELNMINTENQNNPNEIKFLIDRTPFSENAAQAPTIAKTDNGEYYIIDGRVLPRSNIYNRSAFEVRIKVPLVYPFKPPEIEMITPIYHPNIAEGGKICIPMLRTTDGWKSTNTLANVVNGIVDYIDNPNIDEAHSVDIGNEYLNNREEFDRKVAQMIEQNPIPRQ